jgi:hypothetical protein
LVAEYLKNNSESKNRQYEYLKKERRLKESSVSGISKALKNHWVS